MILFPTALLRRHAQTVRDGSSSYKIDFIQLVKSYQNPEGYQYCIKSYINFDEWGSLPIGGVESGRLSARSLRSRPVYLVFDVELTFKLGKLSIQCLK